jgi:hypothetical protein
MDRARGIQNKTFLDKVDILPPAEDYTAGQPP